MVFDQVTVDSAASALRARLFGSGCCFRIGGPCVGQVGAGGGLAREDERRVRGIKGVHKGQRSVSSGTQHRGKVFRVRIGFKIRPKVHISFDDIELRGITPL